MSMNSIPNASPNHQTTSTHANERGERGLDQRAVEQPDAEQHLGEREQRVPHRQVAVGELGAPDDAVVQPARLTGGAARQHLREAVGVHEPLKLQAAVQQPQQPQQRLGATDVV